MHARENRTATDLPSVFHLQRKAYQRSERFRHSNHRALLITPNTNRASKRVLHQSNTHKHLLASLRNINGSNRCATDKTGKQESTLTHSSSSLVSSLSRTASFLGVILSFVLERWAAQAGIQEPLRRFSQTTWGAPALCGCPALRQQEQRRCAGKEPNRCVGIFASGIMLVPLRRWDSSSCAAASVDSILLVLSRCVGWF